MAELTKQTKHYTRGQLEKTYKWYILDATGKSLGRLASQAAYILRGKHRPEFTPSSDMGDHIIVINAEKVKLTGRKLDQKEAFVHSGFPGGASYTQYKILMETNPEKSIELAVKGMLPKNPLGRQMFKKLNVYKGAEHPHGAQNPEVMPQILVK